MLLNSIPNALNILAQGVIILSKQNMSKHSHIPITARNADSQDVSISFNYVITASGRL
jgi:hypothetical protein